MKKLAAFLAALSCLFCLTMPAAAAGMEGNLVIELEEGSVLREEQTILLEDGSTLVVTADILPQTRASATVSGVKNAKYYDSSNQLHWVVTLSGSFTYNGTSATCTSVSIDAVVYEGGWSCASKNADTSGSSAVGSASMVCKVLGIQVDSVPVSLTLTCDKDGVLS